MPEGVVVSFSDCHTDGDAVAAGPEEPHDLEIGQASELVALTQGPSSTYTPPQQESSGVSSALSKAERQSRLHKLQALCADISTDAGVNDDTRSACAVLQDNLSAFVQR